MMHQGCCSHVEGEVPETHARGERIDGGAREHLGRQHAEGREPAGVGEGHGGQLLVRDGTADGDVRKARAPVRGRGELPDARQELAKQRVGRVLAQRDTRGKDGGDLGSAGAMHALNYPDTGHLENIRPMLVDLTPQRRIQAESPTHGEKRASRRGRILP